MHHMTASFAAYDGPICIIWAQAMQVKTNCKETGAISCKS